MLNEVLCYHGEDLERAADADFRTKLANYAHDNPTERLLLGTIIELLAPHHLPVYGRKLSATGEAQEFLLSEWFGCSRAHPTEIALRSARAMRSTASALPWCFADDLAEALKRGLGRTMTSVEGDDVGKLHPNTCLHVTGWAGAGEAEEGIVESVEVVEDRVLVHRVLLHLGADR
jgi:hypothetical protein